MIVVSGKTEIAIALAQNIIRFDTTSEKYTKTSVSRPLGKCDSSTSKSCLEIVCMAFSSSKYLATCTNLKQLLLYDEAMVMRANWDLSRAASHLVFTNDGNGLVVADKTGDVYLYDVKDVHVVPALILGHLSMILDLKISACGRYVITSDRDEKIRISHFPNSYNILSYCLGHRKFVSRIEQMDADTLVSASGDGMLRFWNFHGQQLFAINSNDFVSNKDHVATFAKEMGDNKVDTSALPISDIAVHFIDAFIHFVIHVYACDELQVHILRSDRNTITFSSEPRQILSFTNNIHGFCFANDLLYVFYGRLMHCYQFDSCSQRYTKLDKSLLTDILSDAQFEQSMQSPDKIPLLYRRSFDNQLEYQERKKLRVMK